MTKKSGFKIRVDYFVEIDKKDFGKQAAAFAMIDTITKTGTLPADFSGVVLEVSAKQGSADVQDVPAGKTTAE